MEEQKLFLEDESEDKKYFTIIPNYIANHSTANDQALYFQLKKFAGDKGTCFASEKTLQERLGIGRIALHKSIKYLLDHKWISFAGHKSIRTNSGIQKVKSYKINNIWKMNIDHYEGVSETAPLASRGVQNDIQGVSRTAPNKNQDTNKNQNTATSLLPIQEGINLFKEINPSYELLFKNKTERAAMTRLLEKYGAEKVGNMVKMYPHFAEMAGCPQITTPYQLEKKLGQYAVFIKQQKNSQKINITI